MQKLLLILLVFIGIFMPLSVHAQSSIHISQLNVDIWPEYDQPSVLMIYRMTLAPGTTLPASLAIRIPANAQINAVAVQDSTGGLINAPYERTILGEWLVLKLNTNSPQAQVEFYVPLDKKGTARHIVFNWAGDYPVDKLEAYFLKPNGAENVSISIAPLDTSPGQDGLTNYHMQQLNLAAGQVFSFTIDYTRQTDDLSISSLPVQAASTPGLDTPGRVSMMDILPWGLAALGVLLIVAGVVGFISWQRGGQRVAKGKRIAHRRAEDEDESIYCYHCGKRAQPGDIFCRTCGTRLKRDGGV